MKQKSPKVERSVELNDVLALVRDWGIDPEEIAVKTITVEGYETFIRDEGGKRVLRGDELALEPHSWPEGFPVGEFFILLWEWQKARM